MCGVQLDAQGIAYRVCGACGAEQITPRQEVRELTADEVIRICQPITEAVH